MDLKIERKGVMVNGWGKVSFLLLFLLLNLNAQLEYIIENTYENF